MVTLTQDQPVKTPVRFRVQLRPEATKLVVDFKDSQLDLLRQVLNFLGTQNQEANMESMQLGMRVSHLRHSYSSGRR